MKVYDKKVESSDNENIKDVFSNLFIDSDISNINDNDDALSVPSLELNLDEIDNKTQERAKGIVERLSDYYFDEKYILEHPYIPDKIAQEVDNIRRLLKMLMVNEKAQDTLLRSITINAGKGTLYGSLTSLQNSMLSMQTQLNQLTANLENIFKEMQDNCEKTWEEKDKEYINNDGSMSIKGSREFIKKINDMLNGTSDESQTNELADIEEKSLNQIMG